MNVSILGSTNENNQRKIHLEIENLSDDNEAKCTCTLCDTLLEKTISITPNGTRTVQLIHQQSGLCSVECTVENLERTNSGSDRLTLDLDSSSSPS